MTPEQQLAALHAELEQERGRVSPADIASARQQFTDEEIRLCLQELKNPEGRPLDEFIDELRRMVVDS